MATTAKKRALCWIRSIHEYNQLKVLGKGSYEVVVKACNRLTGDTVSLKSTSVSGAGADDLIREVGCLADCLGHSSIM